MVIKIWHQAIILCKFVLSTQISQSRQYFNRIPRVTCPFSLFIIIIIIIIITIMLSRFVHIYNEYPLILSCQLMVEVSYKTSLAAVPRLSFQIIKL